jgi:hypothetical protein
MSIFLSLDQTIFDDNHSFKKSDNLILLSLLPIFEYSYLIWIANEKPFLSL